MTTPTPAQALLLRAAVLPGDEALRAWRGWMDADRNLEATDPAWRLFPQAYRNLANAGLPSDEAPRLRDAYSAAWTRNQALLARAEPTLAGMATAGIPTMVLKGAALATLHYGDLGARPMDDIDLLVPIARVEDAIGVLTETGWRPGREARTALADLTPVLAARHAIGFEDDAGHQLDLHWYSLWQSAPDDAFWRNAVELDVAGRAVRALDPTDQLLHVCVHGCGRSGAPVRWLADAAMVLRGDEVDWERFVAEARARRVTCVAARALSEIAGVGIGVADEPARALRATRPAMHERWADRAAGHGAMYVTEWDRYRRLRALDPGGPTGPGFMGHLRCALGVPHRRDVLRHVAGNARRALAGRLRR